MPLESAPVLISSQSRYYLIKNKIPELSRLFTRLGVIFRISQKVKNGEAGVKRAKFKKVGRDGKVGADVPSCTAASGQLSSSSFRLVLRHGAECLGPAKMIFRNSQTSKNRSNRSRSRSVVSGHQVQRISRKV